MKAGRTAMLAALMLAASSAGARAQSDPGAWAPSGVFLQAGTWSEADSATAGLRWRTGWHPFGDRSSVVIDAEAARWQVRHNRRADLAGVDEFAATPTARYSWGDVWFVEGAIGLSLTQRHYRTDDKRFSTAFDFADHLGVGTLFGERTEHEVVLRIEHFSNGSIKEPNPGQNFVQLRYAYRFDDR